MIQGEVGQVKENSWSRKEILDWLMDGDPAIRWQVLRDLSGSPIVDYSSEQAKIAQQGWGKKLLSYQDENGTWGGGIYSPKWISTTYTMLTLRRIGLPQDNQAAQKGCQQLLEHGIYQDGGINYSRSEIQSEACITGMVLSILSYFNYPHPYLDEMADHLLIRQMLDGGWNCKDHKGDTHSSFHTTLSALEGLLEYQKSRGEVKLEVEAARLKGHEFLLQHRLYKSHRTGEIVNARMTRMHFPPRWFYDFLKALDYFQNYFKWRSQNTIAHPDRGSRELDRKHARDDRFQDAIQLLADKRRADGRWNMMRGLSGRVFFDLEPAGKPGRWNTLRALRVLKWWEAEI